MTLTGATGVCNCAKAPMADNSTKLASKEIDSNRFIGKYPLINFAGATRPLSDKVSQTHYLASGISEQSGVPSNLLSGKLCTREVGKQRGLGQLSFVNNPLEQPGERRSDGQ